MFPEYKLHSYQLFLISKVEFHILAPNNGRQNLLLSMPPGFAKSWLLADCLIPFLLGHNPSWQICICSYSQSIANQLGKRARKVMEQPVYSALFPGSKISSEGQSGSFELAEGGSLYCVGRGGSLTSRRFHVILLDDGIKNQQEALSSVIQKSIPGFIFASLLTRFHKMEPKTVFMCAETVWHKDLSITMLANKNPEWPYYNLSAVCDSDYDVLGRQVGELLCPEILSKKELEEIRSNSPETFSALYQGNPISKDSTYFSATNLQRSLQKLDEPKGVKIVVLDTASSVSESADYTVASHWVVTNDTWHVARVDRFKVDIKDLLKYVDSLSADYIVIEAASSGLQLLQLRSKLIPSKVFKNAADKETYARALNELLGDKIFINTRAMSYAVEKEILEYPFGAHDDVVLSLLHGYRFLLNNKDLVKLKKPLSAVRLMARASKLN
jgi:hypothetical protein